MRRKFYYRSLQPNVAYHRYRKIYFLSVAVIPQYFRYGYVFESKGVKIIRIFAFSLIAILNLSKLLRLAVRLNLRAKIYLNFTFFDKIRVQSSTGTKFKHFINGKKRESVMFFSDFILGHSEQNKP